jgi:glycosyltransferase involved in cell wall biosynthesis
MNAKQSLSVLIPAYNEERTIEKVLRRVVELGGVLKEIIVVDDGSKDRTTEISQKVAAEHGLIRVVTMERNQGKTAAVQRAIDEAVGEILIIQDADEEYDPAEIPSVIQPILDDRADVVYGSRFIVRRATRVLYFYHYLANKSLTFLSNLLTNRNMSDVETGYKAFRACVIKPFRFTSHGFGMEIEITALICKTNARTYEVPISYYGRTYDEGKKIGMLDGLAAIWYIVRYNLFSCLSSSKRAYVRQVNEALAKTNPQES